MKNSCLYKGINVYEKPILFTNMKSMHNSLDELLSDDLIDIIVDDTFEIDYSILFKIALLKKQIHSEIAQTRKILSNTKQLEQMLVDVFEDVGFLQDNIEILYAQ